MTQLPKYTYWLTVVPCSSSSWEIIGRLGRIRWELKKAADVLISPLWTCTAITLSFSNYAALLLRKSTFTIKWNR